MQKGDARKVMIFCLSKNCIKDKYADIYIFVNIGTLSGTKIGGTQLDYVDNSLSFDRSDDFISKLHYAIVKANPLQNDVNGFSCGMTRKGGRPLAFEVMEVNPKKGSPSSTEVGGELVISFTQIPQTASGIYQMQTSAFDKNGLDFEKTFRFPNAKKNQQTTTSHSPPRIF